MKANAIPWAARVENHQAAAAETAVAAVVVINAASMYKLPMKFT
jgi:hypothetical protein